MYGAIHLVLRGQGLCVHDRTGLSKSFRLLFRLTDDLSSLTADKITLVADLISNAVGKFYKNSLRLNVL